MPLDGGNENLLGGPIGSLFGLTLTPRGPLKDWTDGEIIRAIREGVDCDNHPLILMPSDAFHQLSDSDVQGLVAFLRSQPAVNQATPPRDLSVDGDGAGWRWAVPDGRAAAHYPAADRAATRRDAAIRAVSCRYLRLRHLPRREPGGSSAGWLRPARRAESPRPGSNLAGSGVCQLLPHRVDPNGRRIDPATMPWQDIGKAYTDDELRAINAYIRSLS